jgi:Leucine-rich repeat (LRR) protein
MVATMNARAFKLTLVLSCFHIFALGQLIENLLAVPANVPASELNALKDFYDSTNGPQWVWSTAPGIPWNFTGNPYPCTNNVNTSWQGVSCFLAPPFTYLHVTTINLPKHNITGSIPVTIQAIQNLTELTLTENSLTGTIPEEIGTLVQLVSLDLSFNDMSGKIPSALQSLQQLAGLNLEENLLDGSVPVFLASMPNLLQLSLANNLLTGTIPAALSSLTKLLALSVNGNDLRGKLPAELSSLVELQYLDVGENHLTGSIPDAYTALTKVLYFFVDENALTGSLPTALGNMVAVRFIDVGDNYLSGPLPSTISSLTQLMFFHLHDNYLSSSLPVEIGDLSAIKQLYFSYNSFSGSLPTTLTKLTTLLELAVNDNFLTGSVNSVFNATTQRLAAIQLQDNYFTGNIPLEPFKLPRLLSFVIGENCFVGTLPTEVCNAHTLKNLVFDGLHASTTCQHKILPGLSDAYTTQNHIHGTIPPCYFGMPQLLSLHVSGNEMTGTLPYDMNVSTSLIDLSLSHNSLRGRIPLGIQERAWVSLDLSHNRFDGALSHSFGTPLPNKQFGTESYANSTARLALDNNRLSGKIPSTVVNMLNISILNTNIFSCAADRSDLPKHDEQISKYNCGSTVFDVPYYVWLSVTLTTLGALLLMQYARGSLDVYFPATRIVLQAKQWVNVGHAANMQQRMKTFNHVCDICAIVCKVSFTCAAACVLVLAPIYAILTSFYGTHQYAYAWSVSATFLAGRTPFGILFVFFTLLLCFLLGFYARNLSYNHRDWRSVLSTRQKEELEMSKERKLLKKADLWDRVVTYTPMLLMNVTVVLSANVVFVYIVLYRSAQFLTFAQIVLSLFKLFWNKVGSRLISRWTAHIISKKNVRFARSEFFVLQLLIAVINNIGIPCLVIVFTSPVCLYHIFIAADPVQSYFTTAECVETEGEICVEFSTILHSGDYDPPFTYSYQCSSSFITYYAAAFVNVCLFSTFGTPVVQFLCKPLYPLTKSGTYLRFALKRLVPKLLRPAKPNLLPEDQQRDFFRPYFDANQLLLTLLTNLAIMLTFGVVFPPLAAAMAMTILSIFYFARLKVGIFIDSALAANSPCLIDVVDKECQGVGFMPVLHRSIWLLTVCSFVFYTWFLFDVLGNTEGFMNSFWVFFVYPALACGILVVHVIYRKDAYARVQHRSGGDGAKLDKASSADAAASQSDVEMELESFNRAPPLQDEEDGTVSALHNPAGKKKELASASSADSVAAAEDDSEFDYADAYVSSSRGSRL